MKRESLGKVLALVLRALHDLENDPMSAAVGIYPDPLPALRRIAGEHGWSLDELATATERRVGPKKAQELVGWISSS